MKKITIEDRIARLEKILSRKNEGITSLRKLESVVEQMSDLVMALEEASEEINDDRISNKVYKIKSSLDSLRFMLPRFMSTEMGDSDEI